MLDKTRSRSRLKKPKKPLQRKSKTNEERIHLGRVAEIGCIICGLTACVHHIRTGMGIGQRNSHFCTIPLCHNHHQGADGIHTIGTKVWQRKYGTESELLEKVRQKLGEQNGKN